MAISLDFLGKGEKRKTTPQEKYQPNNFTNTHAILHEEWRLYRLKRYVISIDLFQFLVTIKLNTHEHTLYSYTSSRLYGFSSLATRQLISL